MSSERRFFQRLERAGFERWRSGLTMERGFRGLAPLLSQEDLPLAPRAREGVGHHNAGGNDEWRSDPGDDFAR